MVIFIIKKKYNNMKRKIRLTESDLRRIVNRSVRRVMREAANHNISYNGENLTLNADDPYSWDKLYDIRRGIADNSQVCTKKWQDNVMKANRNFRYGSRKPHKQFFQ